MALKQEYNKEEKRVSNALYAVCNNIMCVESNATVRLVHVTICTPTLKVDALFVLFPTAYAYTLVFVVLCRCFQSL